MAYLRSIAPHRQNQVMNAPHIERRELAPRLEVQVRVMSGEPGASMRLNRYFRLTERGLGELLTFDKQSNIRRATRLASRKLRREFCDAACV